MRSGLKHLPSLAVTCVAIFGVPPAGHAQQGEINLASPASATARAAPQAPEPPARKTAASSADDGALRYYAKEGQKDRVEAELRRLQAASPGYVLPADLYAAASADGSPEDQPLWDLFGAGKIDELKAGIAARKADDPNWQPPADLMVKIRRKELRSQMLALSGEQQYRKMLELVRQDPEIAETGDVELMWSLAESYAHSKQGTQALAIYAAVLKSNDKPQERLATLQKSMASLRMADVETLYAMGGKDAAGKNEFDVILTDLTRARISAFLHDERKDEVNPDQVQLFADYAKTASDPNQPGLVAWYDYKRRLFSEGLDWFKMALEKGGDAKIAHGLAHSLRQLRKFREAEEVSYAWRDYDVANRLLFIDLLEMDLTKEVPPYIEDERLSRYGKVSADDASGEGAQALAWYAYNSCQYFTALEWFQRANAWLPKEATAYGLALTYRRLGDRKNFVETVNRYDGLFPKVVALVFPDDHYLPPTPCEESVLAPRLPGAATSGNGSGIGQSGGLGLQTGLSGGLEQAPLQTLTGNGAEAQLPNPMTDPTIAYPQGTAPNYPGSIHDPLWRYSWGRVPSPTGAPFRALAPNYRGEPWQPVQFNPNEFPLMIDPQNPLRFLATGLPTANPLPAQAVPPSGATQQAREPLPPHWPVLARKVPHVPPMPYETNGFTLQLASVADPRHKGLMFDSVRFVPPPTGNFWNQPVYSQLPPAAPGPNPPVGAIRAIGPQGAVASPYAPPPNYAPPQGFAAVPAYLAAPAYAPAPGAVAPQAYGAAPVDTLLRPASAYAPAWMPQANPNALNLAAQQPYAPGFAYTGAPNADLQPAPAPVRTVRKHEPVLRASRPSRALPASASGGACSGGAGSAAAALTLGWCLMQADRPQEAALAFDRAMAGSGKTREDAAYGKSLAHLRTNLTNSAVEAANSAPMTRQHRNEIGVAVLSQRAQGAYNQGSYDDALAALDQRMAHAPESRDLSLMRGWSLYHLGRKDEAERLFQALDKQTSTKESRQGIGAIYSSAPGRNR